MHKDTNIVVSRNHPRYKIDLPTPRISTGNLSHFELSDMSWNDIQFQLYYLMNKFLEDDANVIYLDLFHWLH